MFDPRDAALAERVKQNGGHPLHYDVNKQEWIGDDMFKTRDTQELILEAQHETNRKLERMLALANRREARVDQREREQAPPDTRHEAVAQAIGYLNSMLGIPNDRVYGRMFTRKTLARLNDFDNLTTIRKNDEIPF